MIIAERIHLFPSRTQKLSSPALKILGGKLPGKLGSRRFFLFLKNMRMMKEQHRASRPALFLSLCVERKGNGRAVSHLISSGPTDVVTLDEGTRVCGQ